MKCASGKDFQQFRSDNYGTDGSCLQGAHDNDVESGDGGEGEPVRPTPLDRTKLSAGIRTALSLTSHKLLAVNRLSAAPGRCKRSADRKGADQVQLNWRGATKGKWPGHGRANEGRVARWARPMVGRLAPRAGSVKASVTGRGGPGWPHGPARLYATEIVVPGKNQQKVTRVVLNFSW